MPPPKSTGRRRPRGGNSLRDTAIAHIRRIRTDTRRQKENEHTGSRADAAQSPIGANQCVCVSTDGNMLRCHRQPCCQSPSTTRSSCTHEDRSSPAMTNQQMNVSRRLRSVTLTSTQLLLLLLPLLLSRCLVLLTCPSLLCCAMSASRRRTSSTLEPSGLHAHGRGTDTRRREGCEATHA